MSKLHVVV